MSPHPIRSKSTLAVLAALSLLSAAGAFAQTQPPPPPPDPYAPPASGQPPDLRTTPSEGLTPGDPTAPGTPTPELPPPATTPPPEDDGAMLDGHPRYGPFLSGPGSLSFVLHHTLMGATGGLVTQGISSGFSLEAGSREAMLVGTLVGAGLGFGVSAWWQFNNWIDQPMGNFGVAHSIIAAMFFAGFVDLFSDDRTALAYTSFLGAELGAWLTTFVAGGEMTLATGLALSSGAAWAMAYMGLLLATLGNSGTQLTTPTIVDSLLIAPGVGLGLMALANLRFKPTATQVLRANAFGAGVGAAVLVLSALVLGGFGSPTPYVLSLVTSAGAIAAVSIFWEESAERPTQTLHRNREKDRPYRNVWW